MRSLSARPQSSGESACDWLPPRHEHCLGDSQARALPPHTAPMPNGFYLLSGYRDRSGEIFAIERLRAFRLSIISESFMKRFKELG